ncbi:ABC transporter permease [Actinophytocola oryzae]|uniref:Peptide/nickel transport system permease protein/oligopeptide transport system permease protein n=1 Tax=Actinophytocola oryzae TaxID=502181 RepID=A0A4R7VY01_9PSEU|nr:ABC transporter permease [Actinophytocola oryzae]TDV54872.1 peptide/nickel transport system permease protein/oligopeptide transport system permease protein [Actinophytocola oryzae]
MTAVDLHAADVSSAPVIEGRGPWQLAWARLRHDRVAVACMVFIVLLVLVAALARPISMLVGYSPTDQDRTGGISPDGLPMPPSVHHWLGTDNLGRDILVRIVYGSQVSLAVGVGAAVVAVLVGVVVGMCAGYLGPTVDSVLARLMDVVLSFPFLLFAIALVTVAGPSELIEVAVIAFFSWAAVGRIVRGQTLAIREKEYVEAARSLGAGPLRIMLVDVLPNLVAPVVVYTTLLIPVSIVFESTLSYLGVGIIPPTPSWGNMISDAQSYYQVAWWFLLFPGLALILTTLAFNLLGDSVRDALDPRFAGRS